MNFLSLDAINKYLENDGREEELKLRELLWLRHGCSISSLYGDDGEMQCSNCLIDFKRDSVERIGSLLTKKLLGDHD